MYPVLEIISELKEKLRSNKIVILQAPPGAGKSTVLPLELLNEQWLDNQKMVMLEPRRLAARSVAMRMANLRNEEVGNTIGYQVRFENVTNEQTRIHVVTEGILTRKIQTDNSLEGIGLVIFDEFHERSLQADLALALCLQVQQLLRPEMRILIMSATLDGEKLSSQLQAPIVTSWGKQFPVAVRYSNFDGNWSIAVNTSRLVKQALKETAGDVLVFLPGAGEIGQTQELLTNEPVAVLPLYGELSFQEQQKAIVPHPQGVRKVVLATSIAETSLTIEGITTVIDTGFARIPRFDPRSGLTRLETVRVTQDAATQRAGRAGRLGPGVCYRMWTEGAHHHLQPTRKPEILEADLATLVLELAHWGVTDVNELTWITQPPKGSVSQAKELLQSLNALNNNKITQHGKQLLKLPTHPRIAHLVLTANATPLAIDVASLIEERDPLPKELGADLSLRVELLRKWRRGEKVNADKNTLQRIERLASSWRRLFKITADNSIVADTEVGRLLMEAYPERIAQQIDKQGYRYKLVNGRVAKLSQNDLLHKEQWLCIAQLDAGEQEGKIFSAAPLSLTDVLLQTNSQESVKWDGERGMVVGRIEERIGKLVVSNKPLPKISDEKRIEALFNALYNEGLNLLGWGDAEKEWQSRVLSLATWRPNEGWPQVEDEQLLATAHHWLAPFLTTVSKRSELQKLDLQAIVQTILPWEMNARLDTLAPTHIKVPSGSHIKILYNKHGSTPAVEVRLQEMFGLFDTPTINEGKTKVMLHLLSPGYKPVQVTQDLKSFWLSTYHQVRKELRIRYPKHYWPEDPWTAEAVKGVVRKK